MRLASVLLATSVVLGLGAAPLCTSAIAAPVDLVFELFSTEVVPPPPVQMDGLASLTLDPSGMRLYGDVFTAQLEFEVHLYAGLPGENGSFLGTMDRPYGVWYYSIDLTPEMLELIYVGGAYLLGTSTEYPDGFIRGQFPAAVVANETASVGALKTRWSVEN